MEKEFVPYELAVKLKSLEFDEPCFGYYDLDGLQVNTHHWYPENKNSSFPLPHTTNNPKISAPTFSQAFRWFREKYNLFGCIDLHPSTPIHWYIRIDDVIENDYIYHSEDEGLKFGTYEMGELACLDKLIEIVEEK